MHAARHPASDFGQLTSLAGDDRIDHKDKLFQVPSRIASWLTRVQLLHGPLYGTILPTAVTHIFTLQLLGENPSIERGTKRSERSGGIPENVLSLGDGHAWECRPSVLA